MLEKLIIVLHLLAALSVIALILLQQGKGADMGASFGAGGSQTVFGAGGGGNVLTRATAILAAVFLATSLGLSVYAKRHASVVTDPDIPVVDGGAVASEQKSQGDVPSAADVRAPANNADIPAQAGGDVPAAVSEHAAASKPADVPEEDAPVEAGGK